MNIGNTLRRIKFWASENQSKYIHTRPIRSSQRLLRENPKDGSCVLSIDVVIYFEMYSSFLLFGPGVRILYLRKVVFRPVSKGSGNVCRGGVERRRFGGRKGYGGYTLIIGSLRIYAKYNIRRGSQQHMSGSLSFNIT